MDHSVFDKELNHGLVRVGEWNGFENLCSITRILHIVRSNPAALPFPTELPFSNHQFSLDQFYVDGTTQSDSESID